MSHDIILRDKFINDKVHGLSIHCSFSSEYYLFGAAKHIYNFIGQDGVEFSKERVSSWDNPRVGTVLNNNIVYRGDDIWESPLPKESQKKLKSKCRVTYVPPRTGDWTREGHYVYNVKDGIVYVQEKCGQAYSYVSDLITAYALPKEIKPGHQCEQGVLGEDYIWRDRNGNAIPPELLRPYSKPKSDWLEPGQLIIDEIGFVHEALSRLNLKDGKFLLYKPQAGDIVIAKNHQTYILPPDFSGNLPEGYLPIFRPINFN